MKKSKFIKSSIILLIGGLVTKVLGLFIKILLTRKIGILGMGLYSMIMPTFMLLLSISGMGLSNALNVLIATDKYNNKNLIITALLFSLVMDIIIFIILFLFGHLITNNLLQEQRLYYPLLSIAFVLPFISFSNIFRCYFFAKERMLPHVISNVLEDLIKLLIIYFGIDYFSNSIESTLTFVILSNIFCEFSSILIFLFRFPKFNITKNDIILKTENIKAIFNIALPTTFSRLVGSITYFLEPIILTTILLKKGYSNSYIIKEYGIINGYILPLIMLPSFFTSAISQALTPIVSKNFHKKNIKVVKKRIIQALFISFSIGLCYAIICFFHGDKLLMLIYGIKSGTNYIKFLLPFFIFYYLEAPLLSSLQALGYASETLKISLINCLIRTIILSILTNLSIGMYSLLIAVGLNILFTVIYSSFKISKILCK